MTTTAREFIDFWIENSVHAVEQFRTQGGSQDVVELARRCINAAGDQGISETDMQDEIGDVRQYIERKLSDANQTERSRLNPD